VQGKTAEETRSERIAGLVDPDARAAIAALQEAKGTRLVEIATEQRRDHERRVAELTQAKVNARNAPQLTPPGMMPPPVLDRWGREVAACDARADLQRLYARQSRVVAEAYDRKIDQRLDAAERPREPGRRLETNTLDRGR
jgi:hypothetical protein